MQNSQDKVVLNHAGLSREAIVREALAYLEYAALAGVDLLPRCEEKRDEKAGARAECAACPLRERREGLFGGLGGERPRLVFVANVPPHGSADSGKGGSPLRGASGELLGKIMEAARKKAGLKEADLRLLFAMRCVPQEGTGQALIDEARRACAPLLREDIARLGPSVVIALGQKALGAVMGRDPEMAPGPVGVLLEHQGCKVMPTHGLEELLADDEKKTLRAAAWKDIQRALKVITG